MDFKSHHISSFNKGPALLPVLVCIAMQAHALESMSDESLSTISGQDGTVITTSLDSATINRLTWQDGNQGSLTLNNISIDPVGTDTSITNTLTVQTGSDADGNPALSMDVGVGRADIKVPNLSLCAADGTGCKKLGALAITNKGTATQLSLVTANGLFNKQGSAHLQVILDNMNIALEQTNGSTSKAHQLILGDMYANITADGKLFVEDDKGLRFIGTLNLKEDVANNKKGLEVLVQHGNEQTDGTFSKSSLGKVALTGVVNDLDVMLRGVSGTKQFIKSGKTYNNIINGTSGIHLRASGNIDQNFDVQLGGVDHNSPSAATPNDGIRLKGWHSFGAQTTANNLVKSFDTGDIYINILPNSSTAFNLKENVRLVRSQSVIDAARNAGYGQNFYTETGDSQKTSSALGSAKQYLINSSGSIVNANRAEVGVYQGYTYDTNKGIVDGGGNRQSVKDFLSDGIVTNGVVENNGGIANNGTREELVIVAANGSTSRYQHNLYDSGSGTSNSRGSRPIYVQRTGGEASSANDGSVVIGSFGLINPNYMKAADLYTGNRLSGNNLSNIVSNPFTVNKYGEVRDRSKNLVMARHNFNGNGFLVKNANGQYVYKYDVATHTYTINAQDQLVITRKSDNAVVDTIQLVAFNAGTINTADGDDFALNANITNQGSSAGQSISVNVRDMSFQAIPLQTEFFEQTSSSDIDQNTQDLGVGMVLYDADANLLLFPKDLIASDGTAPLLANEAIPGYTQQGQAWGYKLNMTTKGSDGDGSYAQTGAKQTSGVLITHKGEHGDNRYLGLRHLDSAIKAQGEVQINSEGVALTAKDFVFAFRGELAAGKLPNANEVFNDNFDRLLVVEGRLKGDIYAKVVSSNSSIGFNSNDGLGFQADIRLAQSTYGTNSSQRIITANGNSSISLAEITGSARIQGVVDTISVDDGQDHEAYKGALNLKSRLIINPDNVANEDLRIRHVGMSTSPIQPDTGYFDMAQDTKVGEIALTKNTLYANTIIRSAD